MALIPKDEINVGCGKLTLAIKMKMVNNFNTKRQKNTRALFTFWFLTWWITFFKPICSLFWSLTTALHVPPSRLRPEPPEKLQSSLSQVMNLNLKVSINIPQCLSATPHYYTNQSTSSCTFSSCFVYRFCIRHREERKHLLDKKQLVKWELDCRCCKIRDNSSVNSWKGLVREWRSFWSQTHWLRGGKYSSKICISRWLINFVEWSAPALWDISFHFFLHFYGRSQETAGSKDGSI